MVLFHVPCIESRIERAVVGIYPRSWCTHASSTMSDCSDLRRKEVRHGFIPCQFEAKGNGRRREFVLDCRN